MAPGLLIQRQINEGNDLFCWSKILNEAVESWNSTNQAGNTLFVSNGTTQSGKAATLNRRPNSKGIFYQNTEIRTNAQGNYKWITMQVQHMQE